MYRGSLDKVVILTTLVAYVLSAEPLFQSLGPLISEILLTSDQFHRFAPKLRESPKLGRQRKLPFMHMIFRTLWHLIFVGRRGSKLAFGDFSRSRFRVWPTDLDVLQHMNNGKYLSIMDVARFDLLQRNGVWGLFQRENWYPVVVGQTISYRKSLNPWQKFWIESKIIGFDEQAVYMEQRFVRPDENKRPEIYACAHVRARILRRGGGVVPIAEIIEKSGANPEEFQLPEDIIAWGQATRLPSTRDDATSTW